MKKKNTIGVIPYFGGKQKMSSTIVDLLDYTTTDTYIEPFGGGASVLLNKPPTHTTEIYNDGSLGVVTLFKILSDKERAYELIEKLYETEYSEKYFEEQLKYKNEIEDGFLQEELRQLSKHLSRLDRENGTRMNSKLKTLINRVYRINSKNPVKRIASKDLLEIVPSEVVIEKKDIYSIEQSLRNINKCIGSFLSKGGREQAEAYDKEITRQTAYILMKNGIIDENARYSGDKKTLRKISNKVENYVTNKLLRDSLFNSAPNEAEDNIDGKFDEMKLAIATYTVFAQSRDGIGKDWGKGRFRTNDAYLNKIKRLNDAIDRLQGVEIQQVDAFLFFVKYDEKTGDIGFGDGFNKWNTENVMMYLDPVYVKEHKEDDDKKDKDKLKIAEYAPGDTYKISWTRKQHEDFLKCIQRAKCKIVVSNYDDSEHLYEEYLVNQHGMSDDEKKEYRAYKRLDYETKTTISNNNAKDTDRTRTECLWYNY